MVEGHEFVIEYLGPGSCFNHTVVFMTDPQMVNVRAVEASWVSYIHEENLESLKSLEERFGKMLNQY